MDIKNIIITGASGNLGLHLLKNTTYPALAITRDNWDQLSSITPGKYDSVIHCAYDLKHDVLTDPATVLDSNIISTAKLLEICKEKNIPNFIFISSCAVYGESSNSSEDKATQPITINGHIKAFNEEIIKSFCTTHNINYLILRPFNSYGGKDTFSVVHKIINSAKNKTTFRLTNDGIAERDFIHVDDIAKITLLLLNLNLKNEIINIGSGETVRIKDILDAVEKKLGKIAITNATNNIESTYSRANLNKLKNLINFKTINIFDFIKNYND